MICELENEVIEKSEILDELPSGICITEFRTQKPLYLNRFYEVEFGMSLSNPLQVPNFYKSIHPDDVYVLYRLTEELELNPRVVYQAMYRLMDNEKNYRWILTSSKLISVKEGTLPQIMTNAMLVPKSILKEKQVISYLKEHTNDTNKTVLEQLTDREREVLKTLVRVNNLAKASLKLEVSPSTLKTHKRNIMGKVGVTSSNALMVFAIQNGLD